MVIDARGKPDTEKDQQLADLTLAAADNSKAVAAARLRLQAFDRGAAAGAADDRDPPAAPLALPTGPRW